MPSKTGQPRLMWRGALLAVVMGAGWGCAQLIKADFDDHSSTNGAGGGGMSAQSAASTSSGEPVTSAGGAPTSTSGTSSATSASASSSSSSSSSSSGGACTSPPPSDTVCGPDGDDDNCDGVIGDCGTKTIYVWLHNIDSSCPAPADDIFMSDKLSDAPNSDYKLVSQFNVFSSKLPNTTELNRCLTGGGSTKDNKATIDNTAPCVLGSNASVNLGFVSKVQPTGYEPLKLLSIGPKNGIVVENATYPNVCCHSGSAVCTAPTPLAYVPTKP